MARNAAGKKMEVDFVNENIFVLMVGLVVLVMLVYRTVLLMMVWLLTIR